MSQKHAKLLYFLNQNKEFKNYDSLHPKLIQVLRKSICSKV